MKNKYIHPPQQKINGKYLSVQSWQSYTFVTLSMVALLSIHMMVADLSPDFTYHDDVMKLETFSALLALCAGNSPVTSEFAAQRPVMRKMIFSLICALIKWWSKQSWGWWFETPSRSLWHHCNGKYGVKLTQDKQLNFKLLLNQYLPCWILFCKTWNYICISSSFLKLLTVQAFDIRSNRK